MGGMKDLFGDEPYDPAKSQAARDAALSQVRANNVEWRERVLYFIAGLPPGWIGIAEDIRRQCNCGQPKSPHAWGEVTKEAVRRKLLVPTGRRLKMRSVRSHARKTDEYRRAS